MDESQTPGGGERMPLPFRVVEGTPPDPAKRLSLTQTRALTWRALTGEESARAVATHAGVDESTVRGWLKSNPRFRDLWEMAARSSDELAQELRTHGRLKSLQTLIDVQDRDDVPASVQVDAASKFLVADSREKEGTRQEITLAMMMAKWQRESEEPERAAVEGEVTSHV